MQVQTRDPFNFPAVKRAPLDPSDGIRYVPAVPSYGIEVTETTVAEFARLSGFPIEV